MSLIARFLFTVEGEANALTMEDEDEITAAAAEAEREFRAALPPGYSVKVEEP